MQYVNDVASPQVAQTFAGLLENTSAPKSGLIAGSISLAILLYGASGIFSQLFDTFNEIWRVPYQARSGLAFSIRNRLVGVVMVLMVGGLLIATLALSSAIAYLNQLLDGNYPRLTSWLSLTDRGLSFILMPFVLSMMFWYFPARKIKWRDMLPAAGLTAALLAASRYLIEIYLRVSTASEVYGAAGSLVMLLVWVYLTGMILFFGAAFSCAWTKIFGSHFDSPDTQDALDHSLLKGLSFRLRPDLTIIGLGRSVSDFGKASGAAKRIQEDWEPSKETNNVAAKGIANEIETEILEKRYQHPPAPAICQPTIPRDISEPDSYNQPPSWLEQESEFLAGQGVLLTPLRRQGSADVAADGQRIERDRANAGSIVPNQKTLRLRRRAA
jgi:membrane protein